jgi:serine/threonine protein kinase
LIGKTISHYKILGSLGSGGAGIVYKAEDLRLNRLVAVKLLRSEWTEDEDAKTRFQREAQAASVLDHPNICAVHEIDETEDGQLFIAMAYYDGETVRNRLDRNHKEGGTGLPFDECIDILMQTAEGLQSAHEAGIIHRDIKPSNLLITRKGDVKMLDFGLAKLAGDMSRTASGATLGTVEYMSPEQAQGLKVDLRTDIWSMGVLLYEMLTGRPPFQGDRPLAVIRSILHDKPERLRNRRSGLPEGFESIVFCALSKNAADRYPSARHMAEDLTGLKGDVSGRPRGSATFHSELFKRSRAWKSVRKVASISAFSLLLAAFSLTGLVRFLNRIKRPVTPVKIVPFTSYDGSESNPAFSPDASEVAFEWRQTDSTRYDIYVKKVEQDQPRRLTYPPGSSVCPAWSPDGRTIAFFHSEKGRWTLNSMTAEGGSIRTLRTLNLKWKNLTDRKPFGDWSPDGRSFVYTDFNDFQDNTAIFVLLLQSSEIRRLSKPPAETLGDWSPKFSRDGKTVAFLRQTSYGTGDIYLVPEGGGDEKRITFDGQQINSLSWMPDGRGMLFSSFRNRKGNLWITSVDEWNPKLLVPGIRTAGNLCVSKDGQKLILDEWNWKSKIWNFVLGLSKNREPVDLPFPGMSGYNSYAMLSPDGKKVAFVSDLFGIGEIWVSEPDGSGAVRLTDRGGFVSEPRWSPDGRRLSFEARSAGYSDIFLVDAGGGPATQITHSKSDDRCPSWSRDGRWIYFSSNQTGGYQIWKMPVSGGNAVQITKEGGLNGIESFDGRWLYFNDVTMPSNGIWKMSLETGETDLVLRRRIGLYNWNVSKDGIFFIDDSMESGATLYFLDFQTSRIRLIAQIRLKNITSLSVSADGRSFLCSDGVKTGDITMVENFK